MGTFQRFYRIFACFDVIRPGRDHEDEVFTKLENQVMLHEAKIDLLETKLDELEQAKRKYVKEKNIPMAKRKIIEKHRVMKQISRFVQLRDACQNMSESISDSSVVKETFTVLSDVSWTFRNVKFDEKFSEQVEKFSEQMDDWTFNVDEMNDALASVGRGDADMDEDLEKELEALMKEDEETAVAVGTPAPSQNKYSTPTPAQVTTPAMPENIILPVNLPDPAHEMQRPAKQRIPIMMPELD